MKRAIALGAFVAACGHGDGATSNDASPLGDRVIRPGEGIGTVTLGMRLRDVRARLGEGETVVSQRLGFARYRSLGLEIVLTSPVADALADESRVIAVAATADGPWQGSPRPGDAAEVVDRAFGRGTRAGDLVYYARGVSVKVDGAGKVVSVAVFAPFADTPEPPPMVRATEAKR